MSWYSTVHASIGDADILSGFDEDQDNWSCDDWRTYYNRIKAKYGKQKAIDVILSDSENGGLFANIDNCKYDCGFIQFFEAESEEFANSGNVFSKIYCGASQVVDTTVSVVTDVGDTVKNVTTTAKVVTSPIILIGGLAVLAYLYYNNNGKR
jgi:hypothetical protein